MMNVNILQKIFAFAALIVFLLSLVLAYINSFAVRAFYISTNGQVDAKYYQQISPAGTAFAIVWPIIYLWNLALISYIVVSVFLPERKSPINFQPSLIPIKFSAGYCLGFGATIGWLVAFDREILELSLFFLILSTLSLYFTLGVSYKLVYDNLSTLDTKENRGMLRLVRGLIHNGLALPATWLTIATHLNLADVVIYRNSPNDAEAVSRGLISVENGSTVILSILFAFIVLWFVLDNFVLEKYTRYTFTVFPVFILGLSGLVGKLRFAENAERNLTLASVILAFSVVALIFRVCYFFYRFKGRVADHVSPTPVKDPVV